jgi:hypothetical protein
MIFKVVAVEVNALQFAKTALVFLVELASNPFLKHVDFSESQWLNFTPSETARFCDELLFANPHGSTFYASTCK